MGAINISKKIFCIFIFLSCIIIYIPSLSAENFYADISIDVDSSGFVTIDGITNHPDLLIKNSEFYTTKKQSYWLFNITLDDIFSDFIYVLTLPKSSSINYIKSSGFISIENNEGNLLVKGFGENESFSIIIQYQTEKITEENIIKFDIILTGLIFGIIILITILIFLILKEKSRDDRSKPKGYEFKGLNNRQREIMNLLIEKNTPMTQTEIQKELKIPKAAISRNIRGLEIKGLIEKEQIGMSNLIRLKKQ
ncbi:hypothetical protein AYK24_04235 [Thermoplasmatales archaeon SG8-52-4]|nr:MAG: hypothetical protein AYK24_04235 [Thermoplasmatales archaeon SG8-52-4]